MRVIGLMSGTSMDAVDAAVVDISARGATLEIALVGWKEEPWPSELRDWTRGWSDAGAAVPLADIARVSMDIGEVFASAARRGAEAAGVGIESVDLIASHGQTVQHLVGADGRAVATLQLGEPAVIAERTGRTVVADFRPRDIAAGGQGAPLVSFVDALMLGEEERTVAALNLGGIANVTVIPAGRPRDAIAFDTGPGNALIDAAARQLLGRPFDEDGLAAADGEVSAELLAELLAEPYFERRPPKSTGRELFGDAFAGRAAGRGRDLGLSDNDMLATLTELTARSVADALARWSDAWPSVVYVSGGGTRNVTLVRRLEVALAQATRAGANPPHLRPIDEIGVPAAAKEALAFAILGHETLHGRANNLPGATGAGEPHVLGAIWPGSNYRQLVDRVDRVAESSSKEAVIERIVLSRSASRGKG